MEFKLSDLKEVKDKLLEIEKNLKQEHKDMELIKLKPISTKVDFVLFKHICEDTKENSFELKIAVTNDSLFGIAIKKLDTIEMQYAQNNNWINIKRNFKVEKDNFEFICKGICEIDKWTSNEIKLKIDGSNKEFIDLCGNNDLNICYNPNTENWFIYKNRIS